MKIRKIFIAEEDVILHNYPKGRARNKVYVIMNQLIYSGSHFDLSFDFVDLNMRAKNPFLLF